MATDKKSAAHRSKWLFILRERIIDNGRYDSSPNCEAKTSGSPSGGRPQYPVFNLLWMYLSNPSGAFWGHFTEYLKDLDLSVVRDADEINTLLFSHQDNLVTVNVARAAHLLPPDPTLPCVSVCLVLWFGLHQLLRKILVKGQETYTQTWWLFWFIVYINWCAPSSFVFPKCLDINKILFH